MVTRRRRFGREELSRYAGATVPDVLPDPLRLLFVGINPSLWTAAVGAHFARPGNRFWPALSAAGITDRLVDASAGMSEADLVHLHKRGVGITNLVARASARADELSVAELVAGRERVAALVTARRPRVVAVAGITAYRAAFGMRTAVVGRQRADLAGSQLWVVPNPSGLNAHESLVTLAAAYGRVADAAGIDRFGPGG